MSKRFARHSILVSLLVVAGVSLASCEARADSTARLTPVPAPVGFYSRVAWVDDWLVVQVSPIPLKTAFDITLWRLHPDGSAVTPLRLPDHPGCRRQAAEAPTRLPDGRLGYIVDCLPPATYVGQLYMLAYTMQTQNVTALLSYPLPSSAVGTGGYSWNPEMTRGITSDGNGPQLSEQLYWFTPTGTQKVNVGLPQAFAAAWAPDGKQIAFLGAPEQGRIGIARADSVFNLYLMQPDGSQIHPLVTGFRYSASLAWSPDSRWIVFPATFGTFTKERGLWLIEVATGQRRLIAPGNFAAPVWAPDGKQLAVIQYLKDYPNVEQQIVLVNVEPLLQSK